MEWTPLLFLLAFGLALLIPGIILAVKEAEKSDEISAGPIVLITFGGAIIFVTMGARRNPE